MSADFVAKEGRNFSLFTLTTTSRLKNNDPTIAGKNTLWSPDYSPDVVLRKNLLISVVFSLSASLTSWIFLFIPAFFEFPGITSSAAILHGHGPSTSSSFPGPFPYPAPPLSEERGREKALGTRMPVLLGKKFTCFQLNMADERSTQFE